MNEKEFVDRFLKLYVEYSHIRVRNDDDEFPSCKLYFSEKDITSLCNFWRKLERLTDCYMNLNDIKC